MVLRLKNLKEGSKLKVLYNMRYFLSDKYYYTSKLSIILDRRECCNYSITQF